TARATAARKRSSRDSASLSAPPTRTHTFETRPAADASGRSKPAGSTPISSAATAISCLPRRWQPSKPKRCGGRARNFEHEYILPEQETRYEADAWEENIREYLDRNPRVTVGQVAKAALSIETPKIGTHDQRRIAAVLTNLGWTREKKDRAGNRWWSKT